MGLIPIMFRYSFEFRRDEINSAGNQPETDVVHIYAFSLVGARKKYKKLFGVDAGEMLARNNW